MSLQMYVYIYNAYIDTYIYIHIHIYTCTDIYTCYRERLTHGASELLVTSRCRAAMKPRSGGTPADRAEQIRQRRGPRD